MSKASALLSVYPVLHETSVTAEYLAEVAGSAAFNYHRHRDDDEWAGHYSIDELNRRIEFYREDLAHLEKALADERVKRLCPDAHASLLRAVQAFQNAEDFAALASVEEQLELGLNELSTFLQTQMRSAFGEFGTHFFLAGVDHLCTTGSRGRRLPESGLGPLVPKVHDENVDIGNW